MGFMGERELAVRVAAHVSHIFVLLLRKLRDRRRHDAMETKVDIAVHDDSLPDL